MRAAEKRRIAKKWAYWDAALALESHMASGCTWVLLPEYPGDDDPDVGALHAVEAAMREVIDELIAKSAGRLSAAETVSALRR